MTRRLLVILALAILAVATANAVFSGASFTSVSTTAVGASTAGLSSDTIQLNDGDGQTAVVGTAVDVAPSVVVTDTGGNPVVRRARRCSP